MRGPECDEEGIEFDVVCPCRDFPEVATRSDFVSLR